MINFRILKFILSLIFLALIYSCQSETKKSLDSGEFNEGYYKNQYFSLEVKIPESWDVLKDDDRVALMRKSKELVREKNEKLKSDMEGSESKVLNLLIAAQKPISVNSEKFRPSFIIIAENVKETPNITKGKNYFYHTKMAMKSNKIDVTYLKNIYERNISSQAFDVLELKINQTNRQFYQMQYATIIKEYALLLILTYENEEDFIKFNDILKSLKFGE